MTHPIGRPHLTAEDTDWVFTEAVERLEFQLSQKGTGAFASPHETLGVILEEFEELKDAVRENNPVKINKELFDIVVAAVWGIASLPYEIK